MTAAYRSNDNVDARLDRIDAEIVKLKRRNPPMDENTKETRIAMIVAIALLTGLLGIVGTIAYCTIDGHRSDERVAHEREEQARQEAAKSMWEHIQYQPVSK